MTYADEDLRRGVDLILKPLLLEVLLGAEAGSGPRRAVGPDADPGELTAAVDELTAIGAVRRPDASTSGPFALTNRGREFLRLLRQINLIFTSAQSDELADRPVRRPQA